MKEFNREIQSGFKGSCYCILSADEFLISDAAQSIKAAINLNEYSIEEFDLLNSDSVITVEALIEMLNTMPFMGTRKAIFVRHSEKFHKKDIARLEDYASNPCPASLLVLFAEMGDSRKANSLAIKGFREIALSLNARDIKEWINSKAQQRGYRFTRDALEYLFDIAGDNPGLLHSEVNKFAALNKDTVDIQDVSGLVYAGAEYGVFNLIGSLKKGDVKETIKGLQRLQGAVEPYQIIGALCWDYVVKGPRTGEQNRLIDTLRILHESDLLIKRAALCSIEMTILKLLKVIR